MPFTKQEVNDIKLDPPGEGVLLPVNPTWSIRVNGRHFGDYLAIARNKPRRSILFLPIADPCSFFPTIWGTITTINDFIYTAFLVPLSLAFNDYTTLNVYLYIDIIGSAIYVLDLIIEFHVGFIVRWDSSSVTITDGIQVAKNYLRNGTFWIDILAILPIIGQIIIACTTGEKAGSAAVRSILLLKLLRLGRVVRLISRMNKFDTGGILHQWLAERTHAVTIFACNTFFSLMVMVNLLACMWWWIAETQGLENSWAAAVEVSKPDIALIEANDSTRWLVCAYYALVTMATIGYGDIVPVTTPEIGLVIIFIFCGVAYFGFVLSTVSALLESRSAEDTLSGGDWSKFQEMENWMKRFSFPKHLQRIIRRHSYASSVSSISIHQDVEFYKLLPLWLKLKVAVELQKSALVALVGGQAVWDTLPEDTQSAVSKMLAITSEPELLLSDVRLYAVGDKAEYLYFLEEGQIGLFVPGIAKVVTVSSPAIIGTGALFGSWSEICSTWKATGRSITRCFVWKVHATNFQKELVNVAPEVLQLILDHYTRELKRIRSQLDVQGYSLDVPGLSLFRKSYDERISGALKASDELDSMMEAIREQEAEIEAARVEKEKAAQESEAQSLQRLGNTGMVEAEVAAEAKTAEASAAAVLHFEMENDVMAAAALEVNEIDLDSNNPELGEDIENRLDRRQDSLYLEEGPSRGVSTFAAAGVFRKEGNTTFVV